MSINVNSVREATARVGEGCRTSVYVRQFDPVLTDEPAQAGGTDTAPTPLELIIAGLASCRAVSIVKEAESLGIELAGLEVVAKGGVGTDQNSDASGLVWRFGSSALHVSFSSSATEQALETLKRRVTERCPAGNLFAAAGLAPETEWSVQSI